MPKIDHSHIAYASRGKTPKEIALRYAEMDFKVFPCWEIVLGGKKAKRPRTENGLLDATTDVKQIEAWWNRWPGSLIGLPTGVVNGIYVLDVDAIGEHRNDGLSVMAALEVEHGMLDSFRVKTASGGVHVYYQMIDGLKSSSGGFAPGIDTRGDGGYVIAPGSALPDGRGWVIEHNNPIRPIPGWLLGRLPVARAATYTPGDFATGETEPGARALAAICGGLRGANGVNEAQHQSLYKAAASAGNLVAAGDVLYDTAFAALLEAAQAMVDLDPRNPWTDAERKRHLNNGLEKGTKEPVPARRSPEEKKAEDAAWRAAQEEADRLISELNKLKWKPWAEEGEPEVREARRKKMRAAPPGAGAGEGFCAYYSNRDNFVYVASEHKFCYLPNMELWFKEAVNGRLAPIGEAKPAQWLQHHRAVVGLTYAPGEPRFIRGKVYADGHTRDVPEDATLNTYLPPGRKGVEGNVKPFLDHLEKLYEAEGAERILRWFAFKVQNPGVKINHALVFGGEPGVGKDLILSFLREAIGPSNFKEVDPKTILESQFNGWAQGVLLRVSEAKNLGDTNRYKLHEAMKTLITAPPETLSINHKNMKPYSIPNIVGVVITTNYKEDGIFIDDNDRRHDFLWSDTSVEELGKDYFVKFLEWRDKGGGMDAVVHLLNTLDVSDYRPGAAPVRSEDFHEVVASHKSSAQLGLMDAIEKLGNPDAFTMAQVLNVASGEFKDWHGEKKNLAQLGFLIKKAGYSKTLNKEEVTSGRWKINGFKTYIYAKTSLKKAARRKAAERLKWALEHTPAAIKAREKAKREAAVIGNFEGDGFH
jgi:hypothetical protein